MAPPIFNFMVETKVASDFYRSFVFTSFSEVLAPNLDKFKYICWQKEICPETKREHYQGYAWLRRQQRLSGVKKALGDPAAHIEHRRGTHEDAIAYCSKKETAVPDTFVEHGDRRGEKRKLTEEVFEMVKKQKTVHEILEAQPSAIYQFKAIRELRQTYLAKTAQCFRKLEVIVHWGAAGTGKTRAVFDEHGFENVYTLATSDGNSIWFDGYEEHPVLLIDDFYGWMKFHFLLRVLDGYPLQLPVKGGFTWALYTKVYITSNSPPSQWYQNIFGDARAAMDRRITSIKEFK